MFVVCRESLCFDKSRVQIIFRKTLIIHQYLLIINDKNEMLTLLFVHFHSRILSFFILLVQIPCCLLYLAQCGMNTSRRCYKSTKIMDKNWRKTCFYCFLMFGFPDAKTISFQRELFLFFSLKVKWYSFLPPSVRLQWQNRRHRSFF